MVGLVVVVGLMVVQVPQIRIQPQGQETHLQHLLHKEMLADREPTPVVVVVVRVLQELLLLRQIQRRQAMVAQEPHHQYQAHQ